MGAACDLELGEQEETALSQIASEELLDLLHALFVYDPMKTRRSRLITYITSISQNACLSVSKKGLKGL